MPVEQPHSGFDRDISRIQIKVNKNSHRNLLINLVELRVHFAYHFTNLSEKPKSGGKLYRWTLMDPKII